MSRCFSSSSRSAGESSSSSDSGWTPLSDRLWATRFSQIDWKRSISNVSTFMPDSPQSRAQVLLGHLVQRRAGQLVDHEDVVRHLEVGQPLAAGGEDTLVQA